ncbi:MAG: anaerobic sulfite reductase subunit AsrA [Lachnospiraceae bacterium]|nr:anaerobic sulfite reductase subunit AsrA [Lachnospiraceae bacterium]
MEFLASKADVSALFEAWQKDYDIYAPKLFVGGGRFSDTDVIRYARITSPDEIVWDKKSLYSFKEALIPPSETLFFYSGTNVTESDAPRPAIIFLRTCDMAAVARLDQIYEKNGAPDYYYDRKRKAMKFVVMPCKSTCEEGYCVSMGTNVPKGYDMAMDLAADGTYRIDAVDPAFSDLLNKIDENAAVDDKFHIPYVTENKVRVSIPRDLTIDVMKSHIWDEYNYRCIACGRCNYVCPTCTCFTMQDVSYDANGVLGERRRVQASCMVDGYTDVAGGASYRKKYGERMRFKALHKVYDFNQRFGYQMCVGCGRCTDVCPEYISFSRIINRLEEGMKEVRANGSN